VSTQPTEDRFAGRMLVETLQANTLSNCHQRSVAETGYITGFNRLNLSIMSYQNARDIGTDMRLRSGTFRIPSTRCLHILVHFTATTL